MQVTRLDIVNFRGFVGASLSPRAGVNLVTGDNGAGKTSVLEALHLMAHGRSFRGRVRDGLIRSGCDALEIFVEWQEQSAASHGHALDGSRSDPARQHRAGLRHGGHAWRGRLDGASVDHLGTLCAALAVITIEPGSHALIMGAAEHRRRFVDWGLFHVEPEFLSFWRRYSRALKQRNALLRSGATDAQLEAWEQEMAAAGERITGYRQRYLEQLQPALGEVCAALLPRAGTSTLVFQPGWRRDELSLADALLLARGRDAGSGFTSVGPHRADWRIEHTGVPGRSALSRGQAKLTALAALLSQAEHHAAVRGDWPVVALDDPASELDRDHQRRVLERVCRYPAQVFIATTEAPAVLLALAQPTTSFHVERGQIHAEAAPR